MTEEQRLRYNEKQKVRQSIYRKDKKFNYATTMFNYWKKELNKLQLEMEA